MLEPEYSGETLVVCLIDANECTIVSVGQEIKVLWHKTSLVPRKQDSGGQSEQRFERAREQALIQWLKQVSAQVTVLSKGFRIILAGPAETKVKLKRYMPESMLSRILAVTDCGYTTVDSVMEVMRKSADSLKRVKMVEEALLADKFAEMLAKGSRMVEYGPDIDLNNIQLILVRPNTQLGATIPETLIREVNHPVVQALGICQFLRYPKTVM